MDILNQIKDKLSTFKNLYDIIRIVNPDSQKVIAMESETEKAPEMSCFDFWSRNEHCGNCISLKAQNENDMQVKLELKEGKIYIIIACPVTIQNKSYVVEMLKDISNSDILKLEGNSSQAGKLISELNRRAANNKTENIPNRVC